MKKRLSISGFSVSNKIMFAALLILVASLLAVSISTTHLTKKQLIKLQMVNSTNSAKIIGSDIKDYMLSGDRAKIDAKIREIIENKQLASVALYNAEGLERGSKSRGDELIFSALKSGQQVDREVVENGTHLLEINMPLANEERCKQCHGADVKFNGVLKLRTSVEQAYEATKETSFLLAVCSVLAVLCGAAGLYILLRIVIMRRINAFVDNVYELSEGDGDLTKRLDETGTDELAQVSTYFNHFLENLEQLFSEAARTAINVAASAGAIQASAQNISTGIEQAALQATSVATASEEMSATSNDIARNCSLAATSSEHSNNVAHEGMTVTEATVTGMEKISEQVKHTASVIESLGARSDQIGAIIGTIEDIADQTNLLALNAAIEAARAGEQGRGFAVVADEVRALAERTTRATREIGDMIKAIQSETAVAVTAMNTGVLQVAQGSKDTERSGEALREILQQIGEVANQVQQISTAAEEQTRTTDEISGNIHLMTDSFDRAVQMTRSQSAESEHLSKMSEELQTSIRRFKTRGSDILMLTVAANDHRLFVNRIRSAVRGETKIDNSSLPDHHNCRFGKWYDTEGTALCGNLPSFRAITPPHERIHALSKDAIVAVNSGQQQLADKLMNEIEQVSRSIMDTLENTRREYAAHK